MIAALASGAAIVVVVVVTKDEKGKVGALQLDGVERVFLIGSALIYVVGVQVPTFRINVPLNDRLQTLDVDTLDENAQASARRDFEARWIRWNAIRTVIASLVSVALMFALL